MMAVKGRRGGRGGVRGQVAEEHGVTERSEARMGEGGAEGAADWREGRRRLAHLQAWIKRLGTRHLQMSFGHPGT